MTTLHPDRPDLRHHEYPFLTTRIPAIITNAYSPTVLRTAVSLMESGGSDGHPVSADLLALYWRHGVTEVQS